ncbi:hypothetical protein F2Q68_00033052 [Brassica cretica]|uniref:Uncharacterized protein n=1 Tax=Brassica cretica TaxID=69181 RepID=A0A8S9G8A1_BRACR|nr:hypothetical protein F2Q68_00033052 [Brassica cretica]
MEPETEEAAQLRDTQSEIADYRRSCDTDPRFSLDAAGRFSVDIGRISVDDPRYSFDEPRASWDGTLIGRTARPPPPPSMLSVVEDAAVHRRVIRSDMQIPVEEPPPPPVVNQVNNESDPVIVPGGSIQTRDYYNDSSSRRRKSLDGRKSLDRSTRKTAVADEQKPRVSISIDTHSGGSMRGDSYVAETGGNGFYREPTITGERRVNGNDNGFYREPAITCERRVNNSNDNNKKSRRWGKWSILGLIYRKNVNKYEEEEEHGGMVESWPELRNGGGGVPRMERSNSNVSWRSSGGVPAGKVNGLERNKSSRYGENRMLNFYMAPITGSRRMSVGAGGGGGVSGGWANSHGHSIARNVMRLY